MFSYKNRLVLIDRFCVRYDCSSWRHQCPQCVGCGTLKPSLNFAPSVTYTSLTHLDLADSDSKQRENTSKNSDVYRHDVSTQCGNIDNFELLTCMAHSWVKQFSAQFYHTGLHESTDSAREKLLRGYDLTLPRFSASCLAFHASNMVI